MLTRIRTWMSSYRLAILTGGIFALPLSREAEGGVINYFIAVTAAFLFGALFGVVILTTIRFFRTARWGYLVVGPLAGSIPMIVVPAKGEHLGGLWLMSSILGLLIALLEWERKSRAERSG